MWKSFVKMSFEGVDKVKESVKVYYGKIFKFFDDF